MTHSRSQVLFWVCQNWLIYTRCDNISSPLHTTAATRQRQWQQQRQPCNDACRQKNKHTVWLKRRRVKWSINAYASLSLSLPPSHLTYVCMCVQRKSSTIYSKVCVHYTYTCHLLAAQLRLVNECLAVWHRQNTYNMCAHTHIMSVYLVTVLKKINKYTHTLTVSTLFFFYFKYKYFPFH